MTFRESQFSTHFLTLTPTLTREFPILIFSPFSQFSSSAITTKLSLRKFLRFLVSFKEEDLKIGIALNCKVLLLVKTIKGRNHKPSASK